MSCNQDCDQGRRCDCAALAEQPAPQVLTDEDFLRIWQSGPPVTSPREMAVAFARAILAAAVPPGHVVVKAAEVEALRAKLAEQPAPVKTQEPYCTYPKCNCQEGWCNGL